MTTYSSPFSTQPPMSQKQNKKQKLIKKWWHYLILFAVIFLISSAILRVLTPAPSQTSPTQLTQIKSKTGESEFVKLTYAGQPIEVPASLPIATAHTTNTKAELTKKLTSLFQLKKIEGFDVWVGDKYGLSLQADSYFVLSNSQVTAADNQEIGLSQALPIANSFVNQYFPQQSIVAFPDQATLVADNNTEYLRLNQVDSAQQEAELIIVPFNYSLAGYPVFYDNSILAFAEITVNAHQEISKAIFYLLRLELEIDEEVPILKPTAALNEAQLNNRAHVVVTDNSYALPPSLKLIENGQFNYVQLEYRVDPDNNLVYPFYRFSGKFTNKDGQGFTGELIVPAVKVGDN